MNDTCDKNIFFLLNNNNKKAMENDSILNSQENVGFGYQNTRQRDYILDSSFIEQKRCRQSILLNLNTTDVDQGIPQRPVHRQIHQVSLLTQRY